MHLKQEKTVLELIHHFGSVDKMSKKTGILRPTIYRFLKGQEIPEHIARRIEAKTLGKFNYKTLISEKTRCYLEIEKFPDSLVEVPISHIIIPEKVPYFLDKKGLSASQQSACIDQDNRLIYGLEAIEACKKQGKKSVLTWRLSLSNLWNEEYEVAELVRTFDQVERSAIEIALKMYVGERRGTSESLCS